MERTNKIMKKIILLLSSITLSAFAMQKEAPATFMDRAPQEIRAEIFKFLETDGDLITNIKKIYAASPKLSNNIEFSKSIVKYIIEKDRFNIYQTQDLINKLQKYANEIPVFKNPEFLTWVMQEKKRLEQEYELRSAAFCGTIPKIKELLALKVNVNAVDIEGESALFKVYGSTLKYEVAELLIANGANPDILMGYQSTMLHNAVYHQDERLASLLLQAGANPNIFDWSDKTPLMVAIHKFNVPLIKKLLTANLDINLLDKYNHTYLINVIRFMQSFNGNDAKDIIKLLLEKGANPNIGAITFLEINTSIPTRYSALRFVRKKLKNEELEKLLIQYGAE
jgi:ankyrin repeat protein